MNRQQLIKELSFLNLSEARIKTYLNKLKPLLCTEIVPEIFSTNYLNGSVRFTYLNQKKSVRISVYKSTVSVHTSEIINPRLKEVSMAKRGSKKLISFLLTKWIFE